ncbi:YdcF family protein [Mesorhizobium sp. CAU 1732]|uniref:YdcF family protein n=1 Tax=Mesorhizobium sp. CAU 1732 TaxID=3140358 RepID=UPI00326115EE
MKVSGPTGAPQHALGANENGKQPPRRGALRAVGLAVVCLIAGGLAFLGGFAAFSTHVARLTTPELQGSADAIIVLTGGQARIDAALELLQSGKGKRLLISGVHPSARMKDLQRVTGGDEKLFSCCIDIDRAALDTIGNAEESAKWVTSHAYGTVIVVTNNYHMPRSLLELKRMVGETVLLPYPVVNTPLDKGEWMKSGDALRVLFMEYTKYLASVARGLLPKPADGIGVATIDASSAGLHSSSY